MIIRDFQEKDLPAVLKMVEPFYTSPGVLHPIPVENFADVFSEMCDGGSFRLRGLLLEEDGVPAGYCLLSFSYSTEPGGKVILIEEIYISPEFRGRGFGHQVFDFLKNEYRDSSARLRLEVAPDNTRAKALYEEVGFETLDYIQMINEDF